jgi:hypothetical protein
MRTKETYTYTEVKTIYYTVQNYIIVQNYMMV